MKPVVQQDTPTANVSTVTQPEPADKKASEESELGDCFVVVNSRGQCWSGRLAGRCVEHGPSVPPPGPCLRVCAPASSPRGGADYRRGRAWWLHPARHARLARPWPPSPTLSQVDLRDFARKPEVC